MIVLNTVYTYHF